MGFNFTEKIDDKCFLCESKAEYLKVARRRFSRVSWIFVCRKHRDTWNLNKEVKN